MNSENQKYYGICFMQEDKGRDTEIAIPIVHAAEKFLNCRIDFVLKWNSHLMYKRKADFIIVPANCIGSTIYHRIAKDASQQGIPVFSFISEGNFRTEDDFNFFGFNPDGKFYQDFVCAWNKRTFDFFKRKVPAQAEKIVLTGAPGFDRYKIYQFQSRVDLLRKYGKERFSKVITYSGWAFGKLQYVQGIEELNAFMKDRSDVLDWTEQQRIIVRETLRQAIEDNPDTLFILKQHPAEYYPGLKLEKRINEMSELVGYDNVLYIEENHEDIHDLIAATDILLGFETTTAIESWLMRPAVPTIFINADPGFPRPDIYKGCILVDGYPKLKALITEFYETGVIQEFDSGGYKAMQGQIIENTIAFADGMNHLRTICFLNETLKRVDRDKVRYKRNTRFWLQYVYFLIGSVFYWPWLFKRIPKISKTCWIFERYKLSNISYLRKRYSPFLDNYYESQSIHNLRDLEQFWERNKNLMIHGK